MPQLHDEGQTGEPVEDLIEVSPVVRRVPERMRELGQHRPETRALHQRSDPFLVGLLFGVVPFVALMREPLPQLRGEEKVWMRRDPPHPAGGHAGGRGAIVRDVDLERREEAGQDLEPLLGGRGAPAIDDSLPVGIGPSGGADADHGQRTPGGKPMSAGESQDRPAPRACPFRRKGPRPGRIDAGWILMTRGGPGNQRPAGEEGSDTARNAPPSPGLRGGNYSRMSRAIT